MPLFRQLDDQILVAGQLRPEGIQAAKAEGVTIIVNNRPDGEQPGQISGAEIETAARAAGLEYRAIPVAGGLREEQVEAMADAIDSARGTLLAYCLSGTRSAYLWALAERARGKDGAQLIAKAAKAGYDLTPIASLLQPG